MSDHREAIMLLNELLAIDPTAMRGLLAHRVPCGASLVSKALVPFERGYHTGWASFGMVDVLNAIFGLDAEGKGRIVLVRDEEGAIVAVAEVADT